MKNPLLLLALASVLLIHSRGEPTPATEMRMWTAKSGHQIEAMVTGFKMGKIRLEKPDGETVVVALDKLVQEDQDAIEDHYNKAEAAAEAAKFASEKPAELKYPLGKITDEIPTANGYTCRLYLPTSLRDDDAHPVLFIQDPGSGRVGTLNRYKKAAEMNRWILATTPQSSNKLDYDASYKAIVAMMEFVKENLPIDEKRIYLSGFSGGSRYSFFTASQNDVAGIIACGAGSSCHKHGERVPDNHVVTYGLCGTNCFNRYDMSRSHAKMTNPDSVLRFFVGNHDWAGGALLEDAMVHLNGVFFEQNGEAYPQQQARFEVDVLSVIESCLEAEPHRAYMLTQFMIDRGLTSGTRTTRFARLMRKLSKNPENQRFVDGLADMDKMAKKVCGSEYRSYKTLYPEVVEAGEKYAEKYAGTPLEPIFLKFKEHVVQP
ncbi:SHD1 domain-containing protein [Sulfuriroseicoccus oceanibius]|uniref:SLA1 homology domain-containing protein n=1 Tax=Sulfuriroseicoccus oceanibius TaxID=2707525 RepID=A0A6B3L0V8_9BACT|nr:SHD1 domain-containing protein [Sulfuriroseicoccus oceanibius]QQL44261.1 hypothetical protein G3M56_010195 [Sulfuriroseicoccus oceanibius]